jgi:hypothetical protein
VAELYLKNEFPFPKIEQGFIYKPAGRTTFASLAANSQVERWERAGFSPLAKLR